MSGWKPSRREFLAQAALISAGLPLASLLRPSFSRAATQVAPLRIIQFFTYFEMPEIFYHPQISTTNTAYAPAGPLANYNLNFDKSILAPLVPFQSDLIVFRGLKYGQAINSHNSYPETFSGFTMANPSTTGTDATITNGSTLDQYLYGRMAPKGMLTPQIMGPELYGFSQQTDQAVSWKNANKMAANANPMAVYNSLFGNFTPPATSNPAAVMAAARRQQSLSFVQTYLQSLMGRLPASSSSYTALQTHLQAAQGLSAQIGGTGISTASCNPPAKTSIPNDYLPDYDNDKDSTLFNSDLTAFTNLIVQGLACDITRFFTFDIRDAGNYAQTMPGLGYTGSDFHGEITHSVNGSPTDNATIVMANYKRFFMNTLANLLTALKAVPDPYMPTQSLYDNTVVLVGSEGAMFTPQSTDPHSNADPTCDQPYILAGGCGGYFKKGQLILAGGQRARAVNVNALFTNIVNAFETNQQQFNPAFVPNLINQYGDFPFTVSPTSWLA